MIHVVHLVLQTPELSYGKSAAMRTTETPNIGRLTQETWSKTPVHRPSSPPRILLWSSHRQPVPPLYLAESGSLATALWVYTNDISMTAPMSLQRISNGMVTVTVTKLRASRPRKDLIPLIARLQVTSKALLDSLLWEFWAVFTRLGSAVPLATLYDFTVTFKHAVWWGPLQFCYFTLVGV
jgi:hypothetical protein